MRRNIITAVLVALALVGGGAAGTAYAQQGTDTASEREWATAAQTVVSAAQQGAATASVRPAAQPRVWLETVTAEVVGGRFTYDTERPFEHVAVSSAAPGVTFGAHQVGDKRVEVETRQRLANGSQVTVTFVFSS
jgi:hypothetical protein